MGQFKPMVKMMTTEPSVVLKLKKGGHVNAKAAAKAEHGHKPMGKMDGGVMGALAGTPALVGRPAVNAPVAVPGRPSMAARRKAMMAKPMGRAMPAAIMKEGGKADMAQDKAMIKKAMKQHDAQEHKGGKGTKLNLKTGGVAMGNAGGYKKGGAVKSGIINTEDQGGEYRNTKMHEAKPDNNSAPTGEVEMGKPGGYKRGGKAQRKANGGAMRYVDGNVTGTPPGKSNTKTGEVMKSTKPGEYKKGGAAKKAEGGVSYLSSVAKEAGDMLSPRRFKQMVGMEPEDREVAHAWAGTKAPRPVSQGGEYDRQGYKDLKKLKSLGFDTRTGETGFKKGGAAKKYADGGRVQDDGRPVKMPQKAPSDPVAISRLSGTFKKGGSVKRKAEGGSMGAQPNKEEKGEAAWRTGEKAENKALSEAMNPMNWFKPLVDKFKGAPGAVTETVKSKTVVPAKKYGGKAC